LGNIAARQLQMNQRSNGSNDPEYDMFCTQKAYEDSPLAGGPNNRFPTTPQLLGMKMFVLNDFWTQRWCIFKATAYYQPQQLQRLLLNEIE
jgi:hypothetical protein